MKIGIYGGTFNPPHVGHFQGAEYAAEELKLDRLLMVPGAVAPHKQLPEDSPAGAQRLQMVRLGIGESNVIEASDLELQREGTSYSYLTVEAVHEQYPDAELYFVMGSDMFLTFEEWKNPDKITALATLVVLSRGIREEQEAVAEQKQKMEQQGCRIIALHNPITDISSTDLRRMLIFRCADPFLRPAVAEYIRENRLYGTGEDYRNLPMEKLEQVVISLLKPSRVKHVLGVRDTAEKLARLYGADVTDAGRAGILHDVTKALPPALQLTLCREYGTM